MEENSNYGNKEKEALVQPMKASEMKKFEKNEKNLLDEIITGTGIKKSVGKGQWWRTKPFFKEHSF